VSRREIHPHWCGQSHVCSIDRPSGEHRSHPLTVTTRIGVVVATRIRTVAGLDRLEVRAVVNLPADPGAAQRSARQVLDRIALALTPSS
jgi:hypothetical protein